MLSRRSCGAVADVCPRIAVADSDRSCGFGPLLHSLRNGGLLLLGRHLGIAVTAFAESSGAVRKHVVATIYAIATIYVIAILIAVVLVIVC